MEIYIVIFRIEDVPRQFCAADRNLEAIVWYDTELIGKIFSVYGFPDGIVYKVISANWFENEPPFYEAVGIRNFFYGGLVLKGM